MDSFYWQVDEFLLIDKFNYASFNLLNLGFTSLQIRLSSSNYSNTFIYIEAISRFIIILSIFYEFGWFLL